MNRLLSKFQSLPYLLLVMATFFWGTNFVFSRMIVEEVPPLQFSVIRWMIASTVFLPFVWREFKDNIGLVKIHWRSFLMLALTGIAGFNTLLYIAMQYTTSINASLVNSLTPLTIVLLSVVFLKERLIRIQYVAVVVSLLGVVVVVTEGSLAKLLSLSLNLGDIIVLAAVTCWATYSVLMKKFGVYLPKRFTFIITMYIGILVLIPFALFERTYAPVAFAEVPWQAVVGIIYLGIFPSIVSFVCWNEGVMQVGPGRASNYLHLIVLFTAILAVVIGGESLVLTQVIGGFFILTGVILGSNAHVFRIKKRNK